jgi:hypothetical protein
MVYRPYRAKRRLAYSTTLSETVLDNALCVKKANRAFYQTFRLSEQDAESRVLYDVAEGAWDTPALRDLLEKVLLENRAFEEFELEPEFPRAGRKRLRMNARRLTGGEMILMSIEDITAHKRAETELRRVQDELRQGQKWKPSAGWRERGSPRIQQHADRHPGFKRNVDGKPGGRD